MKRTILLVGLFATVLAASPADAQSAGRKFGRGLAAVGAGPFDLIGIAIQDDIDDNGTLLDGFEIWARGVDDIQPAS